MPKGTLYIPAKKVQEQYEISASTLRNWENSGKIEAKKTPDSKWLYKADDINKLLGAKESSRTKSKISYARLSSLHQNTDLEHQIQDLRKEYPEHEIVSEITNGVNCSRKKFNAILGRVLEGTV
jgi:predicted site-specific integrase-resolvase